MGSQMFTKIQYGKETTRGTPVAATRKWLGTATIPRDREPRHARRTISQRAESFSTEILQILADPITMSMSGDAGAYYQGLPVLFGVTLKGGVVATETTPSQQDYAWNFTPSLTAPANPDAITLEIGDNDQGYRIEYVMGKTIQIEFSLGENAFVDISAELFGRQVSKNTLTAGISNTAVDGISANSTKIFIDSTWATLGTTEKTGLLRSGSVQINTGNHPKFLAGGGNTFSTHGEGTLKITGNFVLEGGAQAVSIFDDYQAGTARAVRLMWTGPQIGTGVNHKLQLDMYVAFDEVIPLSGFADGNTLYAVTFFGISDNQSTPNMLGVQVVTNRSTY